MGTHLNWGASYLVNDFYRRFVKRDATERHYVAVSRWATVLLFLASIAVTSQLSSIEKAWELLLALGAGTGLVLILRWYWWRINAWSEISAMIASLVVSLLAFRFVASRYAEGDPNGQAAVMAWLIRSASRGIRASTSAGVNKRTVTRRPPGHPRTPRAPPWARGLRG